MNGKRLVSLALAALVAAGLLAAPGAGAKAKKGPVVVGTDVEGDWGSDNASGEDISQVGAEAGMDLVGAEIERDGENVNFTFRVTQLPSNGGIPEGVRYIWSMQVDGEYAELDGKWTNYSRGACDPTAGTCPPPRDPGQQTFLVRGNCTDTSTAAGGVSTCEELGHVQATFDVEKAAITVPVPMALLKIKPGSKIEAGSSTFSSGAGGPVLAIPAAFVSRTDMPRDALFITKAYKVPKK